MALGYIGKILQVDLTNRKIEVEEKDDIFYRSYLGGRGIGYHYLLKRVPPRIDPFSPENIIVFATGVMTGSPIAASCRFSVIGKSPLTGTAGESEAAGFFADPSFIFAIARIWPICSCSKCAILRRSRSSTSESSEAIERNCC